MTELMCKEKKRYLGLSHWDLRSRAQAASLKVARWVAEIPRPPAHSGQGTTGAVKDTREDSITEDDKRRYVCCHGWFHVSGFGHSAWM